MVLLGDKPNVRVFKKLLGSNDASNLFTPSDRDEPTLSGLGINSSSAFELTPLPNLISVLPSLRTYVVNLLAVLINFS